MQPRVQDAAHDPVQQQLRLLKKRHPNLTKPRSGYGATSSTPGASPTPSSSGSTPAASPLHGRALDWPQSAVADTPTASVASTPPQPATARSLGGRTAGALSGYASPSSGGGGYAGSGPYPATGVAGPAGREPMSRTAEPQQLAAAGHIPAKATASSQGAMRKTSGAGSFRNTNGCGGLGHEVSASDLTSESRRSSCSSVGGAAAPSSARDAAAPAPTPKGSVVVVPPEEPASPPTPEAVKAARPNLAQTLQPTTETCPYCGRNFSSEAAARHVPICAKLRTRPKPPSKEQQASYTDALGIRQRSSGMSTCGRPETPVSSSSSPSSQKERSRLGSSAGGARPRSAKPAARSVPERCSLDLPAEVPPAQAELSALWAQLEFLLCDGLEALYSEKSIAETRRNAERCLDFLLRLEETASQLGMRKGALCKLLLPFDSNTDAGYQGNSAAELGSNELRGLLSDDLRRQMVSDAVRCRRLIRVKIADCADVEQARDALVLLVDFLRKLQGYASEQGISMTAVLREL